MKAWKGEAEGGQELKFSKCAGMPFSSSTGTGRQREKLLAQVNVAKREKLEVWEDEGLEFKAPGKLCHRVVPGVSGLWI